MAIDHEKCRQRAKKKAHDVALRSYPAGKERTEAERELEQKYYLEYTTPPFRSTGPSPATTSSAPIEQPMSERERKVSEEDKELLVNMKISRITRREAGNIAELLGGGSVVWSNGKCYPAREVECAIVPHDERIEGEGK